MTTSAKFADRRPDRDDRRADQRGHQRLLSGDTTAFVTVIYNQPKDAAAFEAYYAATHVPLVGQGAAEIGFTRAELTRFAKNLDGSPAALYRQAKLYFPNAAALKTGHRHRGVQGGGR